MVATSFIKIFSITVLVALLTSSVESAANSTKSIDSSTDPTKPINSTKNSTKLNSTNSTNSTDSTNCPSVPLNSQSNSEKDARFIVMLKNGDAAKSHFEMMKECYQKSPKHVSQVGGVNLLKVDKNTLADFSTDGLFGYSTFVKPSFAESVLKKLDGVSIVEKESKVSIQYAVPQNLTRRAVDNNPPKNLDRIDQAKRPLDGKFIFPDSAGSGVNIFVVDTGIRLTHSEFGGRAKFGGSFCDGCNNDDQNGHGTQVSSVAAGKTFGVARKANLIAVRVLDANGAGSNVGVINGLSFVLDQHTKGNNKNSVVSMSLGGTFSAAVNAAVKKLTDAGVHVAVAAGNDGEDACNSSPSSEPSAVTVGATEENSEQITDFSNIGKCVKVFAPGRNIIGAGIKNDNDVAILSGTSQATPHVSGALALLIAKNGNKAPAQLSSDLINLSTKGVVQGIGNSGSPDSFLRTPAP